MHPFPRRKEREKERERKSPPSSFPICCRCQMGIFLLFLPPSFSFIFSDFRLLQKRREKGGKWQQSEELGMLRAFHVDIRKLLLLLLRNFPLARKGKSKVLPTRASCKTSKKLHFSLPPRPKIKKGLREGKLSPFLPFFTSARCVWK